MSAILYLAHNVYKSAICISSSLKTIKKREFYHKLAFFCFMVKNATN
ncbi:Hypothetical protein BN2458_PEG1026 [Helicobacter typhlonius]|uniref:Uncharacterized protein n=1 Tax=Helicobacter typhlonius TaxID=76936 RepID=A0A0S4PW42_9HELI|nr:Hypothetical protein BN2458_PEG1026 [Helicobacter typhlonius]